MSNNKFLLIFSAFLLVVFVLSGCSGSGGSGIDTHSLTVNIIGNGTVDVNGQSVTNGQVLQIEEDTIVDLEVHPAFEWVFNQWIGNNGYEVAQDGINTFKLTMDGNKEITAVFVEKATMIVTLNPICTADIEPADVPVYSSISDAISEADTGDVIEVYEGTYVENITVNKDITLRSTYPLDPEVRDETVIDGGSSYEPVVVISSDCHFYGMKVQNGDCADNIFSAGGGISINSDISPLIEYNKITNNSARYGSIFIGGGSTAVISNNFITNNHASFNGGGIYVSSSSPEIYANTISGNQAEDDGGGINVYSDSYPEIYANIISGNQAKRNGGGISVYNSTPIIYNNTITDNEADFDGNDAGNGGGIYVFNNSDIKDASGSLWVEENSPTAVEPNNTYSGNTHYDGTETDSSLNGANVYWESPDIK